MPRGSTLVELDIFGDLRLSPPCTLTPTGLNSVAALEAGPAGVEWASLDGIQYSNYVGRVTGALLGGAGTSMGMKDCIGVQLAIIDFGAVMYLTL
ncbi:hypothetical protein GGG16DRAFT_112448 [Schizophyllum commune]